ncbi:TlpA family protein disulfide reductase [Pontibacter liquoris]|uniref:TlpA family protein disulfide reductase n=1 Tax=Pontibacter liquoris TaxID=2905677 RepID=UPI001FA6BA0A|nr:TlpA disulfide reductase family protein [Pontibacter liquoris]
MTRTNWLTKIPLFLYFLLLALLLQLLPGWFLSVARAQAPAEGLAIGQPVPDVLLSPLVAYPTSSARISDFKGKLLLLDFWATWCGACKAALPRLEALQQEFGDSLQVLLVTRDEAAKVQAFFTKWKSPDGDPYRLPSAVGSTALDALFPYRLVPHYVWIGPDGTLQAITTSEQVTAANIRRALQEGTMPDRMKVDLDLQQPLFAGKYLPTGNLVHYSILLKGKIDGLPSGSHFRRSGDTIVGRAITNQPLLFFYETVALHALPGYTRSRLLLQVRDLAPLLPDKSADSPDAWNRQHLYSYDLIAPPAEAGHLYERMLEDLNRYSGYHGAIEAHPAKCLVLQLTGSPKKLASRGGPRESTLFKPGSKRLRNAPVSYLVKQLLSEPGIHLPVLDETGYAGNIDLDLTAALDDLPALRRELRRYHLDLVEAERTIPLLVLRDQPPTPAP